MRGLQRSPHVTTTMEFPAESTLVSILYLHSLSTRPVDLPSVQGGCCTSLYITVPHCTVQQGGPVQYGTRASHGSQLTPDWPPVRSVEITAETRKYFI